MLLMGIQAPALAKLCLDSESEAAGSACRQNEIGKDKAQDYTKISASKYRK